MTRQDSKNIMTIRAQPGSDWRNILRSVAPELLGSYVGTVSLVDAVAFGVYEAHAGNGMIKGKPGKRLKGRFAFVAFI